MKRIALALACLLFGGCTLVIDGKVGGIEQNAVPDMTLNLLGFDPHENELMELYLVNDDGFVQAVAIYDPLPDVEETVRLENVVGPTVRRVDFYADHSGSRDIDAPSAPDPENPSRLVFSDHMWRITLDENGNADFMHNINFTDIVNDHPASFVGAGPLELTVTGVGAFSGQRAEVKVWGPGEREVGYYFLGAIVGETLTTSFQAREFVDDGTRYLVEIILGDAAPLCVSGTADASGLTIETSHASLEPCPQ